MHRSASATMGAKWIPSLLLALRIPQQALPSSPVFLLIKPWPRHQAAWPLGTWISARV